MKTLKNETKPENKKNVIEMVTVDEIRNTFSPSDIIGTIDNLIDVVNKIIKIIDVIKLLTEKMKVVSSKADEIEEKVKGILL